MIEVSYIYIFIFKSLLLFTSMITLYSFFYLSTKNVKNCLFIFAFFLISNFIITESKKQKVTIKKVQQGDLYYDTYEYKTPTTIKRYVKERVDPIELTN